ncbi:MAG: hypothetical protein V7L12_30410 [Nostoc sp.]
MNRELPRKTKRSLFPTKRVLKLPSVETIMQNVLTAFLPSQKAKFVFEKPNAEDLVFLK